MEKFFQRHIILIIVVSIVALGTLGFLFALRPALESFRLARAESARIEAEYQSALERLQKATAFTEQLNVASLPEITKLRSMFVTNPEPAYFLNLLKDKAQRSRFLLNSLEIGASDLNSAAAASGPIVDVGVQVQLKGGGYAELRELLKSLTVSVPILDVVAFTFDPKGSTVSLSMTAKRVNTQEARPTPADSRFFADTRFKALKDAVNLPARGTPGKTNPFAPVEPSPAAPAAQ